jgi:hypothetical protein
LETLFIREELGGVAPVPMEILAGEVVAAAEPEGQLPMALVELVGTPLSKGPEETGEDRRGRPAETGEQEVLIVEEVGRLESRTEAAAEAGPVVKEGHPATHMDMMAVLAALASQQSS